MCRECVCWLVLNVSFDLVFKCQVECLCLRLLKTPLSLCEPGETSYLVVTDHESQWLKTNKQNQGYISHSGSEFVSGFSHKRILVSGVSSIWNMPGHHARGKGTWYSLAHSDFCLKVTHVLCSHISFVKPSTKHVFNFHIGIYNPTIGSAKKWSLKS